MQPTSVFCGFVNGGGVRERAMPLPDYWRLVGHLPCFQSLMRLVPHQLFPWLWFPELGSFVYILGPWGPFKGTLLRELQFFPLLQPPLIFYSQVLWDFIFPVLEPWACVGMPNVKPLVCQPLLLPTGHCHLTTAMPHPLHPGSPSLPFLPIWMTMSSLNPWLSDIRTVQLSGSSGCFLC